MTVLPVPGSPWITIVLLLPLLDVNKEPIGRFPLPSWLDLPSAL